MSPEVTSKVTLLSAYTACKKESKKAIMPIHIIWLHGFMGFRAKSGDGWKSVKYCVRGQDSFLIWLMP